MSVIAVAVLLFMMGVSDLWLKREVPQPHTQPYFGRAGASETLSTRHEREKQTNNSYSSRARGAKNRVVLPKDPLSSTQNPE